MSDEFLSASAHRTLVQQIQDKSEDLDWLLHPLEDPAEPRNGELVFLKFNSMSQDWLE
ncbi:hypothetical protein ABT173_08855 [Streptomyces sp. NPDC001795]|uniref:hypothetical protein n=1 Tax=Streptomyces sp. NPDC001795 TaxID=3154525 RepID=UPI003332D4B4